MFRIAAEDKERHHHLKLFVSTFGELVHEFVHLLIGVIILRERHKTFIFRLEFRVELLLHHHDFLLNHRLDERHHLFVADDFANLAYCQLWLHMKSLYDEIFKVVESHGVELKFLGKLYFRLARQLHRRR